MSTMVSDRAPMGQVSQNPSRDVNDNRALSSPEELSLEDITVLFCAATANAPPTAPIKTSSTRRKLKKTKKVEQTPVVLNPAEISLFGEDVVAAPVQNQSNEEAFCDLSEFFSNFNPNMQPKKSDVSPVNSSASSSAAFSNQQQTTNLSPNCGVQNQQYQVESQQTQQPIDTYTPNYDFDDLAVYLAPFSQPEAHSGQCYHSQKKLSQKRRIQEPMCRKRNSSGSPTDSASSSRVENSLLHTTQKFMSLKNEDEIMNLNEAAEQLGVPKRRLYDITNVLEGIDMLEKVGKNSIRWKVDSGSQAMLDEYRQEIQHLDSREKHIDKLMKEVESLMKLHTEDPIDMPYRYVRRHDLRKVHPGREMTTIAIKAPQDTFSNVEVADPLATGTYQMIVRNSLRKPLQAFLCTSEKDSFATFEQEQQEREAAAARAAAAAGQYQQQFSHTSSQHAAIHQNFTFNPQHQMIHDGKKNEEYETLGATTGTIVGNANEPPQPLPAADAWSIHAIPEPWLLPEPTSRTCGSVGADAHAGNGQRPSFDSAWHRRAQLIAQMAWPDSQHY